MHRVSSLTPLHRGRKNKCTLFNEVNRLDMLASSDQCLAWHHVLCIQVGDDLALEDSLCSLILIGCLHIVEEELKLLVDRSEYFCSQFLLQSRGQCSPESIFARDVLH